MIEPSTNMGWYKGWQKEVKEGKFKGMTMFEALDLHHSPNPSIRQAPPSPPPGRLQNRWYWNCARRTCGDWSHQARYGCHLRPRQRYHLKLNPLRCITNLSRKPAPVTTLDLTSRTSRSRTSDVETLPLTLRTTPPRRPRPSPLRSSS